MTDSVVADELKALADDYERRAEKVSWATPARPFGRAGAGHALFIRSLPAARFNTGAGTPSA